MTLDPTPRLELEPGDRPHYLLEGRALRDGDAIEVQSPLGWMPGTFEWTERVEHLARAIVPLNAESFENLTVVLLPGSPCRWPVRDARALN
ncbi:MAG TPA: hypothetical protein VHN99_03100 [Deinococcales bacterium]|nr:hypothetical protein [Deinococcales bacterium]